MLRNRRRRQRVVLAAIGTLALLMSLFSSTGGWFDGTLQRFVYDLTITNSTAPVNNQTVIVALDDYTIQKYGPDRVIGFSPIPAMSMVSYAAGSRYLSLLGGVCMSFYDWYCDLPPASPQTWGEQTDVPE